MNDDIIYPQRRRVVWEHFGDVVRINWWLSILLLVALIVIGVQGVVLYTIYARPPDILSEDEGYVMYRTTQKFRLSEANVENYVNVVSSTLLDINPGEYDLSPIRAMVRPPVLDIYRRQANNTALERKSSGERTFWSLYGVRRLFEPQHPQYIILAVRGELLHIYDNEENGVASNGPGNVPSRPISTTLLLKYYLITVRPSIENPFGLYLAGVSPVHDDVASETWESAKPLTETLAPDGRPYAERGRTTATNPPESR